MFKKIAEFFKSRLFYSTFMMVIGTIIYSFGVVFVLDKGQFYASGVTGISQIVSNALKMPFLKSILIACLNIPLFLIGHRKVSKRFAILSFISVVLQVVFTYVFTLIFEKGWFDPLADLVFDVVDENGKTHQSGTIILALVGGVLCGAGCGLALRGGTSTGGIDIISQAFSISLGIPFAYINFAMECAIIIAGTIVGGSISVGIYTIIRAVVSVVTVDAIHTSYKFQKITVITDKAKEIQEALLHRFPHGITIFKAVGAYTNTEKSVLESVILTYELEEYRTRIMKIDPNAFVYYTAIKGISGNFVVKTVA